MNLLVDLGNSCCKFAVEEEGKIEKYQSQKYGPFGKLYSVKSLCGQFSDARAIVISSVLSTEMNAQIKDTLTSDGAENIYFLDPVKNSFGIVLAYADPSTFGVDRVAALIGANEKYIGNSCIVDIGTAVTIDVLSANGEHKGGVIFPGVASMEKALLSNTKIQTDQTADVEFNVLANSTENAIHSGCMSALVGGVEYVVNNMSSNYDGFDQVILTGGGADLIKPYLSFSVRIEDTLVLDGLSIVSQNI
ncbi:MAG: type III pantothenate kinase [Gammaproteobacteria bacterium]